jgi:hypothetical protein
MRRPSASTLALLAALAMVLVVGALRMAPWLTERRQLLSSVPGPAPVTKITPLRLAPGVRACAAEVALDRHSGVARLIAAPGVSDGPPLTVAVRAGSWRAAGRVAAGYRENAYLDAPFEPPPGDRLATVCVRNAGRRSVALVSSQETPTQTRQVTRIGTTEQPDLTLSILESGRSSLLGAAPRILDRAAAYKAGFLRGWMVAVLALAIALLVPAGAIWALWRALRADERGSA